MLPKLIIKPNGEEGIQSQIVSLAHPRTGVKTRYMLQGDKIFSIMRISTPRIKRSVFAGELIISDGMVYLATPQDTLFHIIPHVAKLTAQHSLPLQDIIDALPEPLPSCTPPHLITAICNCTPSSNVIIPDTYKLSPSRLLRILVRKVDALISVLGTSLVAEFVHKPLALVIGQEPPSNITQITDLARRKCAIDVISADLADQFSNLLYESTDFTILTTYLAHLEQSRAAAIAAALEIPNGVSEKRQAKEEIEPETQKKQKLSQGVKALAKVNTRGMKDMRSFFSKKQPVKG